MIFRYTAFQQRNTALNMPLRDVHKACEVPGGFIRTSSLHAGGLIAYLAIWFFLNDDGKSWRISVYLRVFCAYTCLSPFVVWVSPSTVTSSR